MTAQSRATLKGYLNSGDQPTEAQFSDLVDSFTLVGETANAENNANAALTEVQNARGGKADLDARLDEIETEIGTLTELETEAQQSLVAAVNEVEANHNTLAAEVDTARGVFGNLDARLDDITDDVTTLGAEIDALVIGSGTSQAETITARGTYDTLSDRLDDIVPSTNVYYVDANFTGDQAAHNRYNDITTAIAAAAAGSVIYIGPGTYTETVAFAANNVKLIGSGQPGYDSGTGRLVGGTVIRGRISMGAYTGLVIRDLGVDLYGVNSQDNLGSSNIIETAVHRTIQNVTILGNGYDSLGHGIYASGDYYLVDNVRIINTHHGIAIHGRYSSFSNLIIERCAGSSVIIKSKASVGSVEDINVSNVVIKGDSASASYKDWGGPFVVQASESEVTRNVNISNVTAETCVNGVIQVNRLSASGTIEDIHFTNVASKNNKDLALVGDYWLKSGNNLVFVNCSSMDRAAGYGWNADAATDNLGAVYLHSCTADTTGSGAATGTFTYAQINGDQINNTVYRAFPRTNRMSGALSGFAASAGITVNSGTGATNVANITGIDGGTTEGFSGIILVHARSTATTTSSTAAYMLFVHRTAYDTSATVDVIESAGLTAGSGAQAPSFTWSIDATNHKLQATAVGSSNYAFLFSFTALGNVKVFAL